HALAVNRTMERTRDRDRAALPEPMRRDVRLLGDILGEIIRDSGGPGLLADVERIRHAVIDARHDDHDAGDEIATLVASWSLEQAEQVARAFAVYFHLANLAEEHQRIRNLRERDTGTEPVRESLAAAVAEIGHDAGPEHLRELLASLRVHLVLTAHPTEARRRAVVAALRRISRLLDMLDDQRAAAADHAEARRELREQIDLLWRTSQLRVKAMDPIDEVRTVMTAFDETLFRVVPAVYRELDRAVAETVGPGSPAPAFLRFGSWVGADRDGNPFVTAQVTRETATIQADHVLRALENATTRIGRAAPGARRGARRAPGTARRDRGALAAGAVPDLPALCRAADQRHPGPARRPGLPRAGRVHRRPAHGPGVADRGRGRPAGPRRAAAPHLAGGDVRLPPGRPGGQAAQRGARPGAGRTPPRRLARLRARGAAVRADRGGAGHVPRGGLGAGPVRRGRVPPLRSQLHPLSCRHRRRARTG